MTVPNHNALVWVVDDDAYMLKIFGFILEKNAIPYRCFLDAESLLETTWDDSVTHILTDIHLPGKNGDELCSILRGRLADKLQIIAVTTPVQQEEEAVFLSNGFDNVFFKPFTEPGLLSLLAMEKVDLSFPYIDAMIETETERMEILQHFRLETLRDLETIAASIQEDNRDTLILLVHRLAGRLAQFSQEQLSNRFRDMEHSLLETDRIDTHHEELAALQQSLSGFLKRLEMIC